MPSRPSSRNRTRRPGQRIVNALEQYKEKFGEYPEPADPVHDGQRLRLRLRIGGAMMLYQAITGDGYDNIRDADKSNTARVTGIGREGRRQRTRQFHPG